MLSIERHDTQVSYYTNAIDMASKDIDRLSTDLMYILNNKDNLLNRHAIVSKFNTSLTRDFRGILLSSLIEYINDRAKQYSQLIFDTTNINFELDGNNISISYNNKQYESLSDEDKKVVSIGYNGMPRCVDESQLTWNKGEGLDSKYLYVCHAEICNYTR